MRWVTFDCFGTLIDWRHGIRTTGELLFPGHGAEFLDAYERALTRLMQSMLFEVDSSDPLTFAGVAALLAGVALAACYLPARRAASVDPLMALRHD